jgi:hypothetical protein
MKPMSFNELTSSERALQNMQLMEHTPGPRHSRSQACFPAAHSFSLTHGSQTLSPRMKAQTESSDLKTSPCGQSSVTRLESLLYDLVLSTVLVEDLLRGETRKDTNFDQIRESVTELLLVVLDV